MKLWGVIAIDKCDVHMKGQGHRGQNKFGPNFGISGL